MKARPLDPESAWPDVFTPGDRVVALAAAVVEADGRIDAAAYLDPRGGPVDVTSPVIRFVHQDDDAAGLDVIACLLEAAAAAGHPRVMVGWDPMDAPGLKRLAAMGIKPVGSMPYFVRGHGIGACEVEYVSGYMDATGSTLDLVWTKPA